MGQKGRFLMDDKQAKELLESALDASHNQDFEKAINLYDELIETSENPFYTKIARNNKAYDYYSRGKYDKAIETAKETIEIYRNSNCESALELLGKSYYAKKEYQTALEYLSETLKAYEKTDWTDDEETKEIMFEELYKTSAMCHFNLHQYALAVKYMKEAVSLNPTYAENKKLLEQMEHKLNEAPEVKRTNFGRKVDF